MKHNLTKGQAVHKRNEIFEKMCKGNLSGAAKAKVRNEGAEKALKHKGKPVKKNAKEHAKADANKWSWVTHPHVCCETPLAHSPAGWMDRPGSRDEETTRSPRRSPGAGLLPR